MGTVWAQFGHCHSEPMSSTVPVTGGDRRGGLTVSTEAHGLMSDGLKRIESELDQGFDRVPVWDGGWPWRSLPGTRRAYEPEVMGPSGAAARDERSQLVRKLCAEWQRVPVQPKSKARPSPEPSPFSSWGGPWTRGDYRAWKGLSKAQNAWEQKRQEAKDLEAKETDAKEMGTS